MTYLKGKKYANNWPFFPLTFLGVESGIVLKILDFFFLNVIAKKSEFFYLFLLSKDFVQWSPSCNFVSGLFKLFYMYIKFRLFVS